MTVDEIKERVERISRKQGDDEDAHAEEDRLHQDVLGCIANGKIPKRKAAACAEAALKTLNIEFARWCA